ncbi:hypothetical protein JCM5296_005959 [Sporobolomyces johnsonii]
MDSIPAHWAYLPPSCSSSAPFLSPDLWDALVDVQHGASDSTPPTLTLAVTPKHAHWRQGKQLQSLIVRVEQAGKELLRDAGGEQLPSNTIFIPPTLAADHRQLFGPRPSSSSCPTAAPPPLLISLTAVIPLTSIVLFSLDSTSYTFASEQQDALLDRLAGGGTGQGGEIIREGDVLRPREGRWKVAMAEPVMQGVVVKGETKLLVLPPTDEEDDDDDDDEAAAGSSPTPNGTQEGGRDNYSETDDTSDFEIDESFLANSVLAPPHRQGHTPLTSPLAPSPPFSNSSVLANGHSTNHTFFPLIVPPASIPSISSAPRLIPLALHHPVPSELLTPTPDPEEDDVPRAFLATQDLGRLGLFSGDWVVLRTVEGEEEGRLARVFAADGLVESDEGTASGSIPIHLPPPLLHNLLSPLFSSNLPSSLILHPAPQLSSIVPPSLPTASSVTLARLASPHSVNKLYQPLFLEGLKEHFQGRRRVIRKGDVVAIGIEEGRARFIGGGNGEGKGDEPEEIELPTSISAPTAVVYFLITSLSLPSDETPHPPRHPADLDEELESGALGCYVDPKVTKLLQTGVERGRVPDVGGWLGLADLTPPLPAFSLDASSPTPASRLYDFISAALAPNSSRYDLPLSVLLKGARGSGKRTLVRGVARKAGVHVLELDAFDLIGDTDAKTEGRLRALAVDKALACAPCVLVLRNVEALARKSQALETGQEPPMTTVLRDCFSTIRAGFTASGHPVVILGTTTDVDKLPTGVLGLFKEELALEAPGEPERLAILKNLTKGDHLAPDVALRSLAVQTAALVANDLVDLVRRARAAAAERVLALNSSPSPSSPASPSSLGSVPSPSPQRPTLAALSHAGISLTSHDFSRALDAARASYSESIGAPKIPNVTWDDVGGLGNVKSDILDTIQLPLERPELFADGLKKRSGILLYGPPGTGKTLLAKAVATSCSLNFFSVKGPELLNMYIGESEANVRRVFQRARDAKPCVIFFDELDSVAPKRGNQGDSGGVMDRIVSQLLAELDGMSEGKGGNDVFVIGATNRPDLLDPALLRPGRFDRMLYLGISDTHAAQLKILEALTRKFKLDADVRLDRVAEQCPFNYTGADFYALCSDAMLKAMSRKAEEIDRKIADRNSRPRYSTGEAALLTPQYYLAEIATPAEIEVLVAQQDFEAALAELVPSVSVAELSHYKQVRERFSAETMNSADKMAEKEKQQQAQAQSERDGLLEWNGPPKPNGAAKNSSLNYGEDASDDDDEEEEEEERLRRAKAKGKGKARAE